MCREGCRTKDHASYAECLRSARASIAGTINSDLQTVYDGTKTDLSAYRNARVNGIQPEGTTVAKVKRAEDASRLLGRPYNANVDPPAHMIVNKNVARFVNTE